VGIVHVHVYVTVLTIHHNHMPLNARLLSLVANFQSVSGDIQSLINPLQNNENFRSFGGDPMAECKKFKFKFTW
jgi:hypothetical protein